MGLADKRVVILGGTSGIGLQVGKLAAAEGAHVVLASSSQTKVDRAKDAVPGAEGRTIDLLSQSNIKTFFAKIGAIDHLVYTAGDALLTEPMETLSLERAQAFLRRSFLGLVPGGQICQVQHPGGRIGCALLRYGGAAPPQGFGCGFCGVRRR